MDSRENEGINEAEIRRRVHQRFNERIELYIHLTIYIVANVGMWLFWIIAGGIGKIPVWVLFLITFGWAIGLVGHGAKVLFTSALDGAREREIDRAIERERLRRGMLGDKRKNDADPVLQLSDDGELTPADAQREESSRRSSNAR